MQRTILKTLSLAIGAALIGVLAASQSLFT